MNGELPSTILLHEDFAVGLEAHHSSLTLPFHSMNISYANTKLFNILENIPTFTSVKELEP